MALKNNYLIEKRNILNEIRTNKMTLQQLRFFSIYLAKINSRDLNTRLVIFPLEDFKKIMELQKINIVDIKNSVDDLLTKLVHIPNEGGGFTAFQLFKECSLKKTKEGSDDWYIEIDAHDKALPLMFEFKERYFSYQLWNTLRLKSVNQFRMYEVLKQYENKGERIITISKLKELLGIEKNEYARWDNFKRFVLESCKKALEEYTDIKFTYEPYGKKGKAGKILTLKFIIKKNTNHKDALSLEKFLDNIRSDYINSNENETDTGDFSEVDIKTIEAENKLRESQRLKETFKNQQLFFFSEACSHEFNEKEIQVLYNLVIKIIRYSNKGNMEVEYFDYFKSKYDELNLQSSRRKINNRFSYIKKLFEIDLVN